MTSDITQQQRLSNKHKQKKSFVYQNKGENFKRRSTFPQYNQRKNRKRTPQHKARDSDLQPTLKPDALKQIAETKEKMNVCL